MKVNQDLRNLSPRDVLPHVGINTSTDEPDTSLVAEEQTEYNLRARVEQLREAMKRAAADLDFTTAAMYRDEMLKLEASLS